MIPAHDMRSLSGWCQRRGMSWQPGCAGDGSQALLLVAGGGTERTVLLLLGPELRLLDTNGSVVAAASYLPALLDVLDAGVAEETRRETTVKKLTSS